MPQMNRAFEGPLVAPEHERIDGRLTRCDVVVVHHRAQGIAARRVGDHHALGHGLCRRTVVLRQAAEGHGGDRRHVLRRLAQGLDEGRDRFGPTAPAEQLERDTAHEAIVEQWLKLFPGHHGPEARQPVEGRHTPERIPRRELHEESRRRLGPTDTGQGVEGGCSQVGVVAGRCLDDGRQGAGIARVAEGVDQELARMERNAGQGDEERGGRRRAEGTEHLEGRVAQADVVPLRDRVDERREQPRLLGETDRHRDRLLADAPIGIAEGSDDEGRHIVEAARRERCDGQAALLGLFVAQRLSEDFRGHGSSSVAGGSWRSTALMSTISAGAATRSTSMTNTNVPSYA